MEPHHSIPLDWHLDEPGEALIDAEEGERHDSHISHTAAAATAHSAHYAASSTSQWTNLSRRASTELALHHIFSELALVRATERRHRLVWLDLSACADDVISVLHGHLDLLSELRYLDISHPAFARHRPGTVRHLTELFPLLVSLRVLRVHVSFFTALATSLAAASSSFSYSSLGSLVGHGGGHASGAATVESPLATPIRALRRLVVTGVSTGAVAAALAPAYIGAAAVTIAAGPVAMAVSTDSGVAFPPTSEPRCQMPSLHLICDPPIESHTVPATTVDGWDLARIVTRILQVFPCFVLPLGGTIILSNVAQETVLAVRRHLGIFRVIGDDVVSTERGLLPRRGSGGCEGLTTGSSEVARRHALRLASLQALDEPALGEMANFQSCLKTAYDNRFREFADVEVVVKTAAGPMSTSSTPTTLLSRTMHQVVLYTRCPRLLQASLKGTLSLQPSGISAFEALVRFIYTDCIDIAKLEAEDIHNLRALAVQFALPRLVAVCDFVTAMAEASESGTAPLPPVPPPPTIALDLSRAFGSQSAGADVALVVSTSPGTADSVLHCSKYLLSCVSKYFRAMFTCQLHEATLSAVPLAAVTSAPISPEVWEILLQSLHGEPLEPSVTQATVAPLAHLGHVLGVDMVTAVCAAYVSRTLAVDTAFFLLQQAYIYNAEDLFEHADKFFQSHAEELWTAHLDNGDFTRLDQQVFSEAFVATMFNHISDMTGEGQPEGDGRGSTTTTTTTNSKQVDADAIHRLEYMVFKTVLRWLNASGTLHSNPQSTPTTAGTAQRLWTELNENWLDRLHVERLSLADFGRCLHELFPPELVDQVFGLVHDDSTDELPSCSSCQNRGYVSTVSRCSCGRGCARCSFSPDTFVPVFRTCPNCDRGEVARARDLFYRMAFRPLHLKVPRAIAHRRTSIIAPPI